MSSKDSERELERAKGGERYRIFKFFEAAKQKRIKKEEALRELKVIEKDLKYEESRKILEEALKKLSEMT